MFCLRHFVPLTLPGRPFHKTWSTSQRCDYMNSCRRQVWQINRHGCDVQYHAARLAQVQSTHFVRHSGSLVFKTVHASVFRPAPILEWCVRFLLSHFAVFSAVNCSVGRRWDGSAREPRSRKTEVQLGKPLWCFRKRSLKSPRVSFTNSAPSSNTQKESMST